MEIRKTNLKKFSHKIALLFDFRRDKPRVRKCTGNVNLFVLRCDPPFITIRMKEKEEKKRKKEKKRKNTRKKTINV